MKRKAIAISLSIRAKLLLVLFFALMMLMLLTGVHYIQTKSLEALQISDHVRSLQLQRTIEARDGLNRNYSIVADMIINGYTEDLKEKLLL
jgi:hypothetical protein